MLHRPTKFRWDGLPGETNGGWGVLTDETTMLCVVHGAAKQPVEDVSRPRVRLAGRRCSRAAGQQRKVCAGVAGGGVGEPVP